jgi:transposase
MATIICKKRGAHSYYYYVESARINGKSRIVNQKYLGSAETVLEKISSNRIEPLYSKVLDFGDVTLLLDIALRLGVSDIINQNVHKRDQGLSIGDYIVIAAINRAVSPTSKSGLQVWFERTILTQIMNIDTSLLTSQNYWNNLDISKSQIDGIEDCLVKKIVDTYDINTTQLIYDATNFFTYIDTKQDSEYAKRGHSKEKRNDLRIVGLSMMVSPDHSIPLLYDTYPGNRSDAKQFTEMLNKLKSR